MAAHSTGTGTGTSLFTPDRIAPLFPGAERAALAAHLPLVLAALAEQGLGDPLMALMALATIRAETGGFVPIDEQVSIWNTPADGPPYALYDDRDDLGNQGPGDGAAASCSSPAVTTTGATANGSDLICSPGRNWPMKRIRQHGCWPPC
ncbi:MAG: hypothetical protein QM522_05640 [Chitinophagaceae bacterium]|nr:hypothetical protein [Chitinophagaceae bacterium]